MKNKTKSDWAAFIWSFIMIMYMPFILKLDVTDSVLMLKYVLINSFSLITGMILRFLGEESTNE